VIKKIIYLVIITNLIMYPYCYGEENAAIGDASPIGENEMKADYLKDIEEETGDEAKPELMPGYVTVNFKGADIRAVLNYLSDVGGVDIVPAPDVTGPVTLKLTNKPWETALDIIVRNYGFAYERDGDIIRVVTVDSLKMEELATEVVKLNYAKTEDVSDTIKDILTDRGKIRTDTRTNVLVITDIPTTIYKIKQVISRLDRKTPQVMIEAKIIETVLAKTERMGIDWNIKIAMTGAKRPTTFPFHSFLPDWGFQSKIMPQYFPVGTTGTSATTVGSGGATTTTEPGDFPTGDQVTPDSAIRAFPFVTADQFTFGTLDFSQFSAILEYLKQRSDTDIISNPRITTLNNKEAKIFVGRVHPYISEIKEDEEKGKVSYVYQEKEIGIRLMVTPSVNEEEEIVVKLKPEIKDIAGYQQLTQYFSLPIFSTREAETEVMVRDGDTVFIGGLIKENVIESENKFPILGDLFGDLPFIGNAVKHKSESKEKTELVFFITVHIVKDMKELLALSKTPSEINIPMGKEGILNPPAKFEEALKSNKKVKPIFDFKNTKKKK